MANVVDNSPAVIAALRAELAVAVQETGDVMLDWMRTEMISAKSGVLHTTGPEPLPHRASAPGETPANWTGALFGTLKSELTGPTEDTVSGGGEAAPYLAEDLEFGSVSGRIAPRPMFMPAADVVKPVLVQKVEQAVRRVTG